MSRFLMRPLGPVPETVERSSPAAAASRRASGLAIARAPDWPTEAEASAAASTADELLEEARRLLGLAEH